MLPPCSTPLSPLDWSKFFLATCGTQVRVFGRENLPDGAAIVASNHRSVLDPFVVMSALALPIRYACHFYMTQVPGLREIVARLNCLPLGTSRRQQVAFLQQAESCLQRQAAVGIFPEGVDSMTTHRPPQRMSPFHRGFAQLALRSRVEPLPIVPVAICPRYEYRAPDLPLELFRYFDPTEPSFQTGGNHPVVMYREVDIRIAPPIWIRDRQPVRGQKLTELASRLASQTRGRLLEQIYQPFHT
ncbi:MAG: lysophospholipid acyltransferase family protein [Cyanobacteria bacterium P01_E01_bin.48]